MEVNVSDTTVNVILVLSAIFAIVPAILIKTFALTGGVIFLVGALLSAMLFNLTYIVTLSRAPAIAYTLIGAIALIAMAVYSYFFFSESFTWRQLLGIGIIITGIFIMGW